MADTLLSLHLSKALKSKAFVYHHCAACCEVLDGVDGPRSRHRCATTWSSVNATMRGAVRHADYHNRS